ncbi:YeiH family protein [Schaalia sp. lx-260]|uniref:YeiH family protein n=1 Tax=Schaalia sp. lx-260 TaxID=2899082 RepID=UPI001E5B1A90|nr:putative sulfate exporter family transporter [Schaalia sp. lx-260]MCD4549581.1 putative sulfate exporter family transporter [Schaalia sp. lx-260]
MKTFCQKWWQRVISVDMLLVAVITFLASIAGSYAKRFPVFSLFGALIIALLIGMLLQFPVRRWYTSSKSVRQLGVKASAGLIANKLLRLGIILLGFKLNLHVLFTQGLRSLPFAAAIVALTTIGTYALARALKVSPLLAVLTAGGTSICGAAAVMGISGSITVPADQADEKENNEVMAVATVAIMGTLFALIDILIFPLLGLTEQQQGIVAGASLHEIAHAVAVGGAFGETALAAATIMKLSRVLMLVVAAIAIALWWDKTQVKEKSSTKRKIMFPWFMLGFIIASVLGTYVSALHTHASSFVDVAYIVLGMAMAALGINVNFGAILREGGRAVVASFLASSLLLVLTILVAQTFF